LVTHYSPATYSGNHPSMTEKKESAHRWMIGAKSLFTYVKGIIKQSGRFLVFALISVKNNR